MASLPWFGKGWAVKILDSGDREGECCADARLGFNPYFAVVKLYNFFADGEANAGACVFFLVMQAVEHEENILQLAFVDAYAVVFDRDNAVFFEAFAGDLYFWLFVTIFEGILD